MNEIFNYINFCLNSVFDFAPFEELHINTHNIESAAKSTIIDAKVKHSNIKDIINEKDLISLMRLDPTIEAVFFYRLERLIFLENSNSVILPYLASCMHRRTNCELYYSTEINEGFNIQHGFGIVIGPRYKIGKNFTIHQNVTLGQKNLNSPNEKIIIGDNVTIFAGAIILGNIRIGDNAKIAANSVVLCDIENNSTYAGSPARRVK